MVALAFSLSFPLWQLLLGPIILGIPHFIGDCRYLVLREGLQKNLWFWGLLGLPFLAYVIIGEPYLAMIGILMVACFSRLSILWKGMAVALSILFLVAAWFQPWIFLFGFLHLHNIIGIGIWWFWRRDRAWWEAIPLLILLIGAGYFLSWTPLTIATQYYPSEMNAEYFEWMLAGFAPKEWRFTLVSIFAFLQSAHYIVWVRLIPEEARKQPTPRTFERSLLSLKEDLGALIFFGTALAMILLFTWAIFDAEMARGSYLQLISFHGFLELAILAYGGIRR